MAETPLSNFGAVTVYRDNPNGTTQPQVTNDVNQGFYPGSRWNDSVAGALYMCVDNTAGAAVWQKIVGGGLNGSTSVAGGNTTLSGGSAVSAAGGTVVIHGGTPTSGNNNGGDISLAGGTKAGSGRNGLVIIPRSLLPLADPSVSGALYGPGATSTAGAVSISAG